MSTMFGTAIDIALLSGGVLANAIGAMYLQKQITMLRERLTAMTEVRRPMQLDEHKASFVELDRDEKWAALDRAAVLAPARSWRPYWLAVLFWLASMVAGGVLTLIGT